jgi:hypothetical protein
MEIADTEQVTEQVNKLLEVIGDKECSTKELMGLLGLKHRPTFRDNYLLPALELGYIEITIPDKPNSSKQKFYLEYKNSYDIMIEVSHANIKS